MTVPAYALAILLLCNAAADAQTPEGDMLIDDFTTADLTSRHGARWRHVSDRVMGGLSDGVVSRDYVDGRACLRLTGDVRLENNGGFIQAALDLGASGSVLDASGYTGVRLAVRGNGDRYSVHLRTTDVTRPWQSYRAQFTAGPEWKTIDIPFAEFQPYRIETPLDLRKLRRIGLVAIGREFRADLAVGELRLYR